MQSGGFGGLRKFVTVSVAEGRAGDDDVEGQGCGVGDVRK
jgi:hypothetical protein